MGTLMAYSIGITLPIILMFTVYKCVLSRTTFHRFNRIMLLSIYLVAAAAIPLMHFLPELLRTNSAPVAINVGNVIATVIEPEEQEVTFSLPVLSILLDIYIVGLVLMMLKLAIALLRMALMIARNEKRHEAGHVIVLHDRDGVVPFSWGHWIFINRTDYNDSRNFILAHEHSHLAAGHWIDLLIAEAMIIINWFNPAAWLMRVELQDLHEYEADENVLAESSVNKEEYQLFLIEKTAGTRFASIASSLNHSSLKKRITMMLSKKSRSKVRMRAFALVPAAALALVFVNNPVVASALSSVVSTQAIASLPDKDSKNSSLAATGKSDATAAANNDTVYNAAEAMPQFPGGMKALSQFLSENIKYPSDARKEGKSGTVIVRFTISKTGKVSDAKVMRGVCESLDAEAVRVINLLPDFTPGQISGKNVAVSYTVPVKFAPAPDKTIKASETSQSLDKVEMPQFPGGDAALMKHISENIRYPEDALRDRVEGTVIVQYVIDANGKVGEVKVMRGVSESLDAEAVRVVSALPNFTPAKSDGKPVRLTCALPIKFSTVGKE